MFTLSLASNKKSFVYTFVNYSTIALNILVFLEEDDAINLSFVNKILYSKVNEMIDNHFKVLYYLWHKSNEKKQSYTTSSSDDDNNNNTNLTTKPSKQKPKGKNTITSAKMNNKPSKQNQKGKNANSSDSDSDKAIIDIKLNQPNNNKDLSVSKPTKKFNKPKIDNITKTNIFSLTKEIIEQFSTHKLVNTREIKYILASYESANAISLIEKINKENINFYFYDEPKKSLIIINRSLIDNTLNFLYNNDNKNGDDKNNNQMYTNLYNSEMFTNKSYDFTNINSLIERQKHILNSINEMNASSGGITKQIGNSNNDTNITNNISIGISSSTTNDISINTNSLITLNNADTNINTISNTNIFLKDLLSMKKITLILCQGGYFSIGIYDNNKCIFHKSDHKYVVRKKAGQRQITRDSNAGSNIKSMGSQIRRDQEKKHMEKIKKIMTENLKLYEDSDIILYHAPGFNKYLILDEKDPYWKLRHKFRSICLTSKKANYTEIERIYKTITKVYVVSDLKK